jgi:hypothetical protein
MMAGFGAIKSSNIFIEAIQFKHSGRNETQYLIINIALRFALAP